MGKPWSPNISLKIPTWETSGTLPPSGGRRGDWEGCKESKITFLFLSCSRTPLPFHLHTRSHAGDRSSSPFLSHRPTVPPGRSRSFALWVKCECPGCLPPFTPYVGPICRPLLWSRRSQDVGNSRVSLVSTKWTTFSPRPRKVGHGLHTL